MAIITDFGSSDLGQSVYALADNKIMVLGFSGDNIALARYNANGSLDTSFGTNGKLLATGVFNSNSSQPLNVQLLSDGKFLLAGTINGADFALARYNADGSLDNSFNGNGKVITDIYSDSWGMNGLADIATALLIQADGKYVVAGYSSWYDITDAIVRYNTNGSLDTTFNQDGQIAGGVGGVFYTAAMQPDAKIIMAGTNRGNFRLIRYDRYGNLDGSFDNDGIVDTDLGGNDSISKVFTLNTGKILAIGTIDFSKLAIIRYNANGSLDNTFNTNGKLLFNTSDISAINNVLVLSNGKILAVGTSADQDVLLMRLNNDGSLDTTFGTAGKTITDLGGWDSGNNLTVQVDGKILVTGAKDTDIALLRYNSDGTLDTTFNGTTPTQHAPTGTVSISDTTPTVGNTLTASNTLADVDGLGAINYTWKTGTTVLGTGNNYLVKSTDLNKTLFVTASYTDGLSKVESVNSAVSSAVVNASSTSTAGVNISGTDFVTSEQGDTAIFNIKLNTAPTRDVIINFKSTDTSEAIISGSSSFTFNATNWATAQSLTIKGVSDSLIDGNVAYSITGQLTSIDVIYKTITVKTLTLTNQDTPVAQKETITGTDNVDILQGTAAPSYILGKAGDDDISGGAGNDTLYGSYGSDNLFGEDGNDYLWGEQDADYLDGGAGNDTLDGGTGADTMIGGTGNDTYYLGYDATDMILDGGSSADTDTVIMPYQLSSYTLPTGIENGTIAQGTSNSNLTGNTSNNTLTGNDGINNLSGGVGRDSLFGGTGNDILEGGTDNDVLTGGAGKDTFKLITAPNTTTNLDKITDYSVVDDTIQLENAIFTKLTTTGILSSSYFKIGTAAGDTNDYIIYNSSTGALTYDSDGSGAGAGIQIATLGVNLALTNADFVVI